MILKIREKGDKKWTEVEVSDPFDPDWDLNHAAENFVEENGLEDDTIVEIFRHGKFKVNVVMEPEFFSRKLR